MSRLASPFSLYNHTHDISIRAVLVRCTSRGCCFVALVRYLEAVCLRLRAGAFALFTFGDCHGCYP